MMASFRKKQTTAKDMATGIENTSAQTLLQSSVLTQLAQQSGLQRGISNRTEQESERKANVLNSLHDHLDLSSEAMKSLRSNQNALNTLEQGRGVLEQQALDSLGKQLQQIKESLGFLEKLLQAATGESRDTIVKGIGEQANNLEKVGRQLGLISQNDGVSLETTNASLQSFSLSASFNSVTQIQTSDGTKVTIKESVSLDFDFLSGEISTQRIEADSDSLSYSTSVHSASISQLDIASERTITVEQGAQIETVPAPREVADIYKDPIGALQSKYLPPYKDSTLQIEQLVKDFEARFTEEEQFPPSIFNQIKRLVNSALSAEKSGLNTTA